MEIACPNTECDASYTIPDGHPGPLDRCRKCGTRFPLVPPTRAGAAPSSVRDGYDLVPEPAESALPESFGRYKVLRLLGRGGMGSVYLALDGQLNRQVALKVPHIVAFADRPDIRERFFREAQAAARFHHPNFCPIHDIGEVDGVPFLTMAYIEGETLSASIDPEGWPARRAAELTRELAVALAELHRQGIIHRDLKPANVMVDARGRAIVMDFGLARWYDDLDSGFTPAGAILGTPAYMPPEQAAGDLKAVGPRSDLYSLGVILYEFLTGRRPFEGPITAILGMIAHVDPTPPSALRPGLDPGLESICLKAMAKKPGDRYASMDEFAGALQAWLVDEQAGPEPKGGDEIPQPEDAGRGRPPIRAWIIAATIALAAVLLVVFVVRRGTNEAPRVVLDPPREASPADRTTQTVVPMNPDPSKVAEAPVSKSAPGELGRYLTKRMALPPTRLVHDNEFDSPPAGLPKDLATPPERNHGRSDGLYYVYAPADPPEMAWDIHTLRADGLCEVVARVVGDSATKRASWSVIAVCGKPDARRGIRVRIDAKGQLFVEPDSYPRSKAFLHVDPRVGPITHPAIRPGVEFNKLQLLLRKRELVVFVNGEQVCDPVEYDYDITPCMLEFGAVGPGRKRAEFDRLEIRELIDPEERKSSGTPEPSPVAPKPPDVVKADRPTVAPIPPAIKPEAGKPRRRPAPAAPTLVPPAGPARLAKRVVGTWTVEGDEIVKANQGLGSVVFGDDDWVDYDLALEASKSPGPGGLAVGFRRGKTGLYTLFLGGDDHKHSLGQTRSTHRTEIRSVPGTIRPNEWYKLKISVRGPRLRVDLDNKLLFDCTDNFSGTGGVSFGSNNEITRAAGRFRNIKVTDPGGVILWEGPPDLR